MIITWLSGLLLLIELNLSPSPSLLCPFPASASLSLAPLFISLSFSFLFVMFFVFFIPLVLLCPCFSCLHYFLSLFHSLSLHSCSFLLSLPVSLLSFIFFSPCPPFFFLVLPPSSLSSTPRASAGFFSSFLPLLLFISLLSLSYLSVSLAPLPLLPSWVSLPFSTVILLSW